jgi:hypothetical protein
MALSIYIGQEPLSDIITSYRAGSALYGVMTHVGRLMRYSWRTLKSNYDGKRVMKYAVQTNRELLFRFSHDKLRVSARSALVISAKYGRPRFMNIAAIEWSAMNHDDAMITAAANGKASCIQAAHDMGSTAANKAMSAAAAAGHVSCISLCVKLGATDFNGAFVSAAVGGKIESLFLLRDYGATNMLDGYTHALTARQTVCASQCKRWAFHENEAAVVLHSRPINVNRWTLVEDMTKKGV